jgi:hypothetical protein
MALGSIQPLIEMSTRNLPGGEGRPVRQADITANCLKNVGATAFHNPMGLDDLLQGLLYLTSPALILPKLDAVENTGK